MKVFIVIIDFERPKEIIECLSSIKKSKLKERELVKIVLVENGNPSTLNLIKEKFKDIELIINKKNTGFAQGNNLGIKFALKQGADYILIINNDTLVARDALFYLLKTARKVKKAGLVSPKIYFAAGFEYHKEKYQKKDLGKVIWYAGGKIDWQNILGVHLGLDEVDKGQFEKRKEVEFASGCCLLIKREVFEKVGFFEERYFLYLEDMDFCVRVLKAGFKIIFEPKAKVWHKNLGTNNKNSVNLQNYFYTRNRLLFGFKYASLRTKIALAKESLKFILKGSYWQKRGVLDFYLRNFGKGSYFL